MSNRPNGSAPLFIGLLIAAAVVGVAFGPGWMAIVTRMETSPVMPLPGADPSADYLMGLIWAFGTIVAVLLIGGLLRFRGPLLTVWIAKLFVDLTIMLLYDYTYGVDPDGYYLNASTPGFTWDGFTMGQGTLNTRTLTWLHYAFVNSSFNATRLTFSLIGLAGLFLVYRAAVLCTGREGPRVFFAFAFVPSVLFWSSILGKDPIAFFGISAYVFGVVAWHTLNQNRYLLWMAAGLLVAVYIRMWFAPILLIPLGLLGWMRSEGFAKRSIFVALGLVGVLLSPLILKESIGVDLFQEGELLETADTMARVFPGGGSSLEVPDLATPGQIAAFAPLGVFTVFFRPLPGEVNNVFGVLTGIENAFLLILTIRAIYRTKLRDLKEPLVAWALAALLIWAGVYSIASFQNLGTLSRYKLQIMPIFLGLLYYLGRKRDVVLVEPPRQRPILTQVRS